MPNRALDGPTPGRPDPDHMTGLNGRFALLLDAITQAARRLYADRLESVAVFGSVGRGTMRPDSDIDLLLAGALSAGDHAPGRGCTRLSRGRPVLATSRR